MTKKLLFLTLFSCTINAQNIVLTPEQQANWQIKVDVPLSSERLPLGEFIAQVVTPPTLLHTISLPFEANVKKLHVANYQKVSKDQILADVTGTEWIATQQKAIADAIEFKHHEHLAERKNILCKEEIIPQKECVAANAELAADKIKVTASKALLKSYGASDAMISTLFKNLTLSQTIQLRSDVEGRIVELHATPGKSTSPSDALFMIQQEGALWLESAIAAKRTQGLEEGQKVQITLDSHTFDTSILQLSPVINPENQTRQIRFLIPSDIKIFSGLRSNAKITLAQKTLKIEKKSVIKDAGKQIVFVKTKNGYNSVAIEILAEDNRYYYVSPSPALEKKIAVSSLAVLKNLLGGDDE
ncbi:MAG: HlyD family efflux transporter periplasmic adaptor subunit [Sulfurovum sp.]|nr:HlyD family efflux transporter periplasmic adaptor subunit [Sulfurovum sp.]